MSQQLQADLIDFTALSRYNDNYKFVLVSIDVFSKFAWVECLKNKNSTSVIRAFDKIYARAPRFLALQTDRGTEFTNKQFQSWLKRHKIHFFHTHNYDTKAAIAERFIRTLKQRIFRYFTAFETSRYVDVIQDLVHSYNHTYHRSIKTDPASVNRQNQSQVWNTLYGDVVLKEPKLHENDLVRVSLLSTAFKKRYLPGWSEELFVVDRVVRDQPNYYKIKDLAGELLTGFFYEEELQKIYKDTDVYVIEHILKKRRRGKQLQFYVKWRSYPDKFNSWIGQSQLTRYA